MPDPSTPPEMLWRALVDSIDAGLLVLDPEGNVTYANQSAADLLNYRRADLTALDEADMLALCQPHRLDVERLATVLQQDLLGPRPVEAYRVATQRRRLLISPFALELPGGRFRCLLIQDDTHWRSDLIADTVMRDLRSPLAFTISYSDALLNRLQSPNPYREELVEYGKIIRNGMARALSEWERLNALHQTDPRLNPDGGGQPVLLAEAARAALATVRDSARAPLPHIEMDLPAHLPPVEARPRHARAIMAGLIREAVSRLEKDDRLRISASQEGKMVQVSLSLVANPISIRASIFDALPLSTVEQTIIMYGGRLWIEGGEAGQPTTINFTLPVWQA